MVLIALGISYHIFLILSIKVMLFHEGQKRNTEILLGNERYRLQSTMAFKMDIICFIDWETCILLKSL